MKKCGYCAKEISYDEMFCCNNCEDNYNHYFKTRLNCRKFVNFLYILGAIAMIMGVFTYPIIFFHNYSPFIFAGGVGLMGILTLILPSPSQEMIAKHKLRKAIKRFRIFALAVVLVALAAVVFGIVSLCI